MTPALASQQPLLRAAQSAAPARASTEASAASQVSLATADSERLNPREEPVRHTPGSSHGQSVPDRTLSNPVPANAPRSPRASLSSQVGGASTSTPSPPLPTSDETRRPRLAGQMAGTSTAPSRTRWADSISDDDDDDNAGQLPALVLASAPSADDRLQQGVRVVRDVEASERVARVHDQVRVDAAVVASLASAAADDSARRTQNQTDIDAVLAASLASSLPGPVTLFQSVGCNRCGC